jgi:para-nitrobenzyl esterase
VVAEPPERFLDPDSFDFGAAHESELHYLFGLPNPPTPYPGVLTAAQQLASAMRHGWRNFAATGAPSSPGQPVARLQQPEPQILSLVPPQPRLATDFAVAHHCAFWSSVG